MLVVMKDNLEAQLVVIAHDVDPLGGAVGL